MKTFLKKLPKKIALVFLLTLMLTNISCQDEINEIINEPDAETVENLTTNSPTFNAMRGTSNNSETLCTNFEYPISFNTYDSQFQIIDNTEVANDDELTAFLSSMVNGNNVGVIIEIDFPINLILSDNTIVTVNNNEELVNELNSSDETCVDLDTLFACVLAFLEIDIIVIDNDSNPTDGITSFELDFTFQCNGIDYDLSYYETQEDADNETNVITFPYTNTSNPQVLYVRAETEVSNDTFHQTFVVNLQVVEPTGNTTCPDDFVSFYLNDCKWNITSIDISGTYSQHDITFNDDGTIETVDTSNSNTYTGTWSISSVGTETLLELNFASPLQVLNGTWEVTECSLNNDDAYLQLVSSQLAAQMIITRDCD
jgi:hypothetical protein